MPQQGRHSSAGKARGSGPPATPARRRAARRVRFFVALGMAALLLSSTSGKAWAGPKTAAEAIDQAKEYAACMDLARADPETALKKAQDWRKRDGKLAARHCTAVALIGQQRFIQAAGLLEQLAQEAGGELAALKGDLLGQAGQAWLMAGEGARAIAAFTAALDKAPNDIELLIDRAIAYASEARYWQAIDDLNRATEITPDRADAYLFRASAYRSLDSLELAAEDVNRSLALQPENPDALLERGIISRLADDDEGARRDWLMVLESAPDSPAAKDARRNLDRLHRKPE